MRSGTPLVLPGAYDGASSVRRPADLADHDEPGDVQGAIELSCGCRGTRCGRSWASQLTLVAGLPALGARTVTEQRTCPARRSAVISIGATACGTHSPPCRRPVWVKVTTAAFRRRPGSLASAGESTELRDAPGALCIEPITARIIRQLGRQRHRPLLRRGRPAHQAMDPGPAESQGRRTIPGRSDRGSRDSGDRRLRHRNRKRATIQGINTGANPEIN